MKYIIGVWYTHFVDYPLNNSQEIRIKQQLNNTHEKMIHWTVKITDRFEFVSEFSDKKNPHQPDN